MGVFLWARYSSTDSLSLCPPSSLSLSRARDWRVEDLGLRLQVGRYMVWGLTVRHLQGYLAHKKQPPPLGPPYDHRCVVPLQGPRRGVFLMSELPLWCGARVAITSQDGQE